MVGTTLPTQGGHLVCPDSWECCILRVIVGSRKGVVAQPVRTKAQNFAARRELTAGAAESAGKQA